MLNDTITHAERELYLTLLELAQQQPSAYEWLTRLPTWLNDIKDKANYAHAPAYQASVARLPQLAVNHVDLNSDILTIEASLNESQRKQTTALLKQLMPWRKGPFQIGGQIGDDESGIKIDTEWHSDWKWQRVAPHLSRLDGRRVLDVGGGSGYHGWRMAGAGADTVIIIDPSCLFYHQFMAIRHFVGSADAHTHNTGRYRTHYIPVPLEALPEHSQLFDTVFSMGVLYHRQSPFEHLQQLKGQLVKGGELVLETLVIEGDANTVLVPHDRYAQMNNVYFLPSVAALIGWLEKAGFSEVRCVDVAVTSMKEQRKTEWMTYHSLADFLDPNDSTKTIEGYPAPMRATLIAKSSKTFIVATISLLSLPALAGYGTPSKDSGFVQDDWQVVCDNTRTCRVAGYSSDASIDKPVSVLFTVSPKVALPKAQIQLASKVSKDKAELWLNNKNYGTLQPAGSDAALYDLSAKQTQAIIDKAR